MRSIILLLFVICSGCSFVDPSASGNVAGGQAHEMSMPEDGKLVVTHIYERKPSKTGANAGIVYNRRSISDWFFGTTNQINQDNNYVK